MTKNFGFLGVSQKKIGQRRRREQVESQQAAVQSRQAGLPWSSEPASWSEPSAGLP